MTSCPIDIRSDRYAAHQQVKALRRSPDTLAAGESITLDHSTTVSGNKSAHEVVSAMTEVAAKIAEVAHAAIDHIVTIDQNFTNADYGSCES